MTIVPPENTQPSLDELLAGLQLEPELIDELSRAVGEPGVQLHRRSLPVLTPRTAASMPSWAAGTAPESSVGPVTDASGLAHWIDIYRPVRHVRLVRTPGGDPFLTVSLRVPLSRIGSGGSTGPQTWQISAGSVWFASTLVAAAAPAGSFCGLAVTGGTLRFGQPVTVNNDEIVVPLAAQVDLNLDLAGATPITGTGPGGDARAAALTLPTTAQLTVTAAGGTLATPDTARLLAYGTDVIVTPSGEPARYDAAERVLVVPMQAQPDSFAISAVASALFVPAGTASISAAGWTIPAAVVPWASLGDAAGAGGITLWLEPGLTATWVGQSAAVALADSALQVTDGRLEISAPSATGDRVAVSPRLDGLVGARLHLAWDEQFPLTFISGASGAEVLLTDADLSAALPKPVDLGGQPIPVESHDATVALLARVSGTELLVLGALSRPHVPRKLVSFGLVNAVLTATYPQDVSILGGYDGTVLSPATIDLTYTLESIIPTLPDPYASSAGSLRSSTSRAGGALHSTLHWDASSGTLEFRLPGSTELGGGRQRQPFQPQTSRELPALVVGGRGNDPLTEAVGDALAFERNGGLVLLDVSTNVDQFGVAFAGLTRREQLDISQLTLELDSGSVALLTLPAVQWEPVITVPDPEPAFPERLSFANSGVPSLVETPASVELVPVRPDVILQRIVDDLAPDGGEQPGSVVAARFTLPFGMLARAELARPLRDRPHGAYVSWNRPVGQSLTGAHQLRIDAVDLSMPDGPPSLPGYTVQLPVASPGGQSVLADTIDTFNTYLGEGGARPLVPLLRLDISGYGESVFSDWRNPYNDPVAVAQARFDVLIGRTSYEVIQIRSWLFPYAVEVVRTFTMQRQNNAAVIRTDSGWVAVTDGEYAFPNGLQTHPGVVTKISKVSRIRETGQVVTQDGYEVATVYFDGDLTLDGTADPVPAKDQFGFVQLAPAGALLDATVYADLIASLGPLGGPVDTSINVGGGPQVVHLSHVDVGVTAGMGGPEFVMAGWGAPAFPGGGQWSMVRVPGPGQPATPVDKVRGTPLIRAGTAGTPPPSTSAYRFSDPADLAHPDSPAQDYAILHAMGTQRAMFSRPKIEATDVGRVTSTQAAALADPYVLAASPGPFPALTAAVPTPSANWSLHVDGAGNYRLDLPGTDFPVSVGRRTARQAGSVKSDLDYTGATISYAVDTSQPVPWTFGLTGAAKIMNTASLGDITTLRANVVASAGSETRFEDPHLQMGGSLSVVQDLLTILADLGITGFLAVSMTNDWDLKITEKIPIVDRWGRAYQIPPLPPPPVPPGLPDPQIKFDDCEISCDTNVAPSNDEAEFDLAGAPMFAVRQVPGLYVVAVFKFSIKVSTADGTDYGLLLGVGIAYDKDLGIFEFKGLFAITFFGFISDTAIGFGIGFLLQLSASIEPIIEVQLSLEGQLALVWGCRGTPDETLFGAAKLTFAFEVTVCLCFSISFEASTTASEVIHGPDPSPCPLPDVLPSAS